MPSSFILRALERHVRNYKGFTAGQVTSAQDTDEEEEDVYFDAKSTRDVEEDDDKVEKAYDEEERRKMARG